MSASRCEWGLLVLFISPLFCGCISTPAPGIAVFDTHTGEKISQIKDAGIDVPGSWAMVDMEILLPGPANAQSFRTIYTNSEGWCVREFDGSGALIASRTLPGAVLHGIRSQYALSPDLSRIAYCDDNSKSIALLQTNDGTKRTILPNAFSNPYSVDWIDWLGTDSLVVCIEPYKDAPYQGCIVSIPLGAGEPHILYQHPRLWDASLSPARTHLAVVLMYTFPKPSDLLIIDLTSGAEKLVATFERAAGHIGSDLIWSPDGRAIAYDRDIDVEIYSLDTGKRRLVRHHDKSDKYLMLGMSYVDDNRIACSYVKGDGNRGRLEILDASTGETIVSKLLYRGGALQVFDNGDRLAVEGR